MAEVLGVLQPTAWDEPHVDAAELRAVLAYAWWEAVDREAAPPEVRAAAAEIAQRAYAALDRALRGRWN